MANLSTSARPASLPCVAATASRTSLKAVTPRVKLKCLGKGLMARTRAAKCGEMDDRITHSVLMRAKDLELGASSCVLPYLPWSMHENMSSARSARGPNGSDGAETWCFARIMAFATRAALPMLQSKSGVSCMYSRILMAESQRFSLI